MNHLPHRVGGGANNNQPPSNKTTNRSDYHRFHLRFIDNRKTAARDEISMVTFGKLDAPLTRLKIAYTGYYRLTGDIRTIDKLLTDHAITELAKVILQPAIPTDIKAKRAISIRQIDTTVGGCSVMT